MYYLIKNDGVVKGKGTKEISKKVKGIVEEKDFKTLGKDKILFLQDDDLGYVQDLERIASIPFKQLYKRDNLKLLVYIIIVILIIILIRG